jgi:hypothetical protein
LQEIASVRSCESLYVYVDLEMLSSLEVKEELDKFAKTVLESAHVKHTSNQFWDRGTCLVVNHAEESLFSFGNGDLVYKCAHNDLMGKKNLQSATVRSQFL